MDDHLHLFRDETIPEPVIDWLKNNHFGQVQAAQAVGGGCINHGRRLRVTRGGTFFLKTNRTTPADMFTREAEGLNILRIGDGPHAPEPFLCGPDFILMEDLAPGPRQPDYWHVFGCQMAALHLQTQPRFGFLHDNYIGSTPQPNPWFEDGFLFFGEQRLLFQAQLANQRGLLASGEVRRVERLARRLPDLIPAQPASLVHGDLWGGNAMTDAQGRPAIIDPAAHYGWAEAELAMTTLFGAFPEGFYRAYQEARPLEEGFWQRFPIYNLYHLLNHLNLFGAGYLGEVLAILRQTD
jgi:protein-ribulosamine 3-kinase